VPPGQRFRPRGKLYRADLRELNELNYARFDAKLEQRLAELRAELRTEVAGLRAEFRTGLQEVRTEVHQGNTALEQVRAELLRYGCSASGSPPSSGLPAC
jgi:hypothetical protein